jgi:sec-independent protein translocase protein TatA
MILMIGGSEIVIILVVVLLMFGAKKLPSLMKDVGKGINEFNKTKDEIKKELKVDDLDIVKDVKKIKEVIKK